MPTGRERRRGLRRILDDATSNYLSQSQVEDMYGFRMPREDDTWPYMFSWSDIYMPSKDDTKEVDLKVLNNAKALLGIKVK